MSEDDGLIWAFRVASSARGQNTEWDELDVAHKNEFRWIHLELEAPDAMQWVREKGGLGELEVEALLAEETRPRSTPMGEGLLLILRGGNLNHGHGIAVMVFLVVPTVPFRLLYAWFVIDHGRRKIIRFGVT